MGKHCQKVVVNPKILHFQKIVPKQCKIILTFNCDNPHCWSFGTFVPHFSNWVFRFMGTSPNPSTICQRAAEAGWLLTACAHEFLLCGYTGKLLEQHPYFFRPETWMWKISTAQIIWFSVPGICTKVFIKAYTLPLGRLKTLWLDTEVTMLWTLKFLK